MTVDGFEWDAPDTGENAARTCALTSAVRSKRI
jgi:hypothetical protein